MNDSSPDGVGPTRRLAALIAGLSAVLGVTSVEVRAADTPPADATKASSPTVTATAKQTKAAPMVRATAVQEKGAPVASPISPVTAPATAVKATSIAVKLPATTPTK
jgi:hypothetical protein